MSASHTSEKFQLRYKQAQAFIAPLLQKTGRPLSEMRALEIGCGEGPKSCALAPLFKHYVGIDLDADAIAKARNNAKALDVANAELRLQEAADLAKILAEEKFDVVFLYAVLEHLTVPERLATLRLCWEALPENGLLYIGEAPNRIAPFDYHSSKLPYFHMMPPQLARQFVDRSEHENWKTRVRSEESMSLGLFRNGQHVGFEEFEQALPTQHHFSSHFLSDNWCEEMLNLYPLRWFEPRNLQDFATMRSLGIAKQDIHPAFARYWIEGILSKTPVSGDKTTIRFLDPIHPKWRASKKTTQDRMGVPITWLAGRESISFELPKHAKSVGIGLSQNSAGACDVYFGDERVTPLDYESVRKGNRGMSDLQSWTVLDLPEGYPGVRLKISARRGANLGVCPVFYRGPRQP